MSLNKKKALEIVKTLNKHKGKKGMSVGELCNKTGMFPSDVEATLKELKESKAVECYIYKGTLYAVFKEGSIKKAMERTKEKAIEKSTGIKMHG